MLVTISLFIYYCYFLKTRKLYFKSDFVIYLTLVDLLCVVPLKGLRQKFTVPPQLLHLVSWHADTSIQSISKGMNDGFLGSGKHPTRLWPWFTLNQVAHDDAIVAICKPAGTLNGSGFTGKDQGEPQLWWKTPAVRKCGLKTACCGSRLFKSINTQSS